MKFEMIFQDHIEATRRAAELVESGVTAKYMGLWDGLYVVEYEANDPLPARILTDAPEPAPVEMQYINRSTSDGALWPTMFPITSPGWVQIGAYPIEGRHEVGDTVLVANNDAKPEDLAVRGTVKSVTDRGVEVKGFAFRVSKVHCINFSKGDHLSESEREAWEAEAAGFQ